MTNWYSPLIGSFVLVLGFIVQAAPIPIDATKPITSTNAHQVRAVGEVKKRASRLVRAPKAGELVLLDWNNFAEIVEDVKLRPLRQLVKGEKPTDLALSPDGKYVAWTNHTRKFYTVEEIAFERKFNIEVGESPGFASFSPDSKLLAIGKTYWDPNAHGVGHSEVLIYDTAGNLLRTLDRTGPGAVHPVFSPDGKKIAVGNRNYETRLYDVATGKLLHVFEKKMIQEIRFSPNGNVLAAGYVDGTVALWDTNTGKLLHQAPSGCHEIYCVDWNPKGDVLATSGHLGPIVRLGRSEVDEAERTRCAALGDSSAILGRRRETVLVRRC
jgi:WD40 repeat protein